MKTRTVYALDSLPRLTNAMDAARGCGVPDDDLAVVARHDIELECRLAVRSQIYAQFPRWGGRLGEDHMIDLSLLEPMFSVLGPEAARRPAVRRAPNRARPSASCPLSSRADWQSRDSASSNGGSPQSASPKS